MRLDIDGIGRLAWLQLWQLTIAIGVAALAARLIGRRRPHLTYGLWMLVIVKCLTPPLWSSPTGIFCWAQTRATAAQGAIDVQPPVDPSFSGADESSAQGESPSLPTADPVIGRLEPTGRTRPGWRAVDVMLGLWLGGMTVCAAVVAAIRVRCSWVFGRRGNPPDASLSATVASLADRLGVKRKVNVIVTTRPFGPAVFGVLRPTIVMPESLLSSLSPDQLEPILAHELVHIRRGDVAAGFVQVLALIAWWFHPLVWWANRAASSERERCCDEESLAGLGCAPGRYARALLNVVEMKLRLRPLFTLPGVRPLDVTGQRLEHIMTCGSDPRPRTTRRQWLALAAIAVMLIPGSGLSRPSSPRAGAQPLARAPDDRPAPIVARVRTPQPAEPSGLDRLKAEVEKLGGSFSEGVTKVMLEGTETTDADLARIAMLLPEAPKLRRIALSHTRITDAGLASLRDLTGLTWIYLKDTDVTDAGLAHLKRLTAMVGLDLENTGVGDEGMRVLAGMPKLEWLSLGNTKVGDVGLSHLSSLRALEVLTLEETPITDAGLGHLKGMTRLRYLHLNNDRIGDAGLASLKGLMKMQRLYLCDTDVSDAGLVNLEGMKDLYYLILQNSIEPDPAKRGGGSEFRDTVRVSDAGLKHLSNLPKLRMVFCWNTAVTEAGASLLKEKIPELEIVYGKYDILSPFSKRAHR